MTSINFIFLASILFKSLLTISRSIQRVFRRKKIRRSHLLLLHLPQRSLQLPPSLITFNLTLKRPYLKNRGFDFRTIEDMASFRKIEDFIINSKEKRSIHLLK